MNEGFVQIGDAGKEPHHLAIDFGKENEVRISQVAEGCKQFFDGFTPPGSEIWQVGEGFVEKEMHPVNFLIPFIQPSPADEVRTGGPGALCHVEEGLDFRSFTDFQGIGQVVAAGRCEAVRFKERLVI